MIALHLTLIAGGQVRRLGRDPVWPHRHAAGLSGSRVARRRRAEARRRGRRLLARLVVIAALGVVGAFALSRLSAPEVEARVTQAVGSRSRARAVLHPPAPIPGYLLIADRGNNRMLLVDGSRRILWRYPAGPSTAMPFHFDDDTFFGPSHDRIISNQEDQDTIQVISFPGRRVLWRYGHVNVRGGAPGYLNTPDDAYLLRNGLISVADAYNCRVIWISRLHKIVRQIGTTGVCRHDPPRSLGSVNGATPLPDGGVLVSEIAGSWIDDFAPGGGLRWAFRAPVSYPSDPQLIGPDRILLADYARPGAAIITTRTGRVLWRYAPQSGPGELDHPSLAMRLAPGLIAINDDYRDRVVVVSIREHRIVWQYGRTDRPGTAPGYLNTPDGMDLLSTHAAEASPRLVRLLTRPPARSLHTSRARLAISTPYRLPAPVEREVAVAYRSSAVIAGGLGADGSSTNGVFRLDPATGSVSLLGTLPRPFHDAAGAILGHTLFVFGGGSAVSTSTVQAFDLVTGRGQVVGSLPTPLSDLASTTIGKAVYLVGGFDGRAPRREVYRTLDGRTFTLVGRLPFGLRYPAVASADGKLVIAGGASARGATAAVYVFDPASGRSTVIGDLPVAVGHAAALASAGHVYVIGGAGSTGAVMGSITEIDPRARSIVHVRGNLVVRDAGVVQFPAETLIIGGATGAGTTRAVRRVARG
jgi:hypothetical protein